ncbi:MAG: sugar transferase [bacterium]
MENNISDNSTIETGVDNSMAAAPAVTAYGLAETAEYSIEASAVDVASDLWQQIQYFWGEYFKGILFVMASTMFILAVPSLVLRRERALNMWRSFAKRSIDIIGALVGLLLSAPIWIILPLLIKLDSRGPVFYTQVRVGQNRRGRERRYCQQTGVDERRQRDRRRDDYSGTPFKVIKFRTMVDKAEHKSGPVWATKNDPRVTRLGNFMRKTRLDEIPQFLNVLTGEMSLIGPRPERPAFVSDLCNQLENYERRLELKPGITGLAQVEAGYDSSLASVKKKLEYDLTYIDNWSLWLDIKILFRTVIVVFTGRGAC